MGKDDIIKILRETRCTDPCECPFNLCDYDEKYNLICESTDPPFDPWDNLGSSCPFCEKVADVLETNLTL